MCRCSASRAGRASGVDRISTCQPGCTSRQRSTSSLAYASTRGSAKEPPPVLLDDDAVELETPAAAQVLDHVPVQRTDVRAAEERESVSERQVDGSVHLLVEERVPHVPLDARVAADPELAEPPGALVEVEPPEEIVLL